MSLRFSEYVCVCIYIYILCGIVFNNRSHGIGILGGSSCPDVERVPRVSLSPIFPPPVVFLGSLHTIKEGRLVGLVTSYIGIVF